MAFIMYKIKSFTHDGIEIPLTINDNDHSNSNSYTIIIGKNGVGKSRLLASMASSFIQSEQTPITGSHNSFPSSIIKHQESKVIAVSTSPFDIFKLPKKNAKHDLSYADNYRYVGMRGHVGVASSALSLISSATKGILEQFITNERKSKFIDVFATLGFSSKVRLILRQNFTINTERNLNLSLNLLEQQQSHWLRQIGIMPNFKAIESLSFLSPFEIDKLKDAFYQLKNLFQDKAISIDLDFSSGEVECLNNPQFDNPMFVESVAVLLNYNLLRLMDMRLYKNDYGSMSLRRASSGEQCMLVIMLGIAGHITDRSLVFIDEPEISLHPKWQEEFMPLLIKTFSPYKQCQFFIATHSPQIIAKVTDKNCFVTSLSNNCIYSPSFFRNKSADFQLAELFEAPGFKNEYITRKAFSLLAKVKRNKCINQDDQIEIKKLTDLAMLMDKQDPTYELIASIKELVQYYANN